MNTNEIDQYLTSHKGTYFSAKSIAQETNTHEKSVLSKLNKLKGNKEFIVKIERRGVKNRPVQLFGYLAEDHILNDLLEEYTTIKSKLGDFTNSTVVASILVAKQVKKLIEEMKQHGRNKE